MQLVLVRCDHVMVLLAKLDTDLIDQTEVRQVFKFAVAVNSITNEATLAVYILLGRKFIAWVGSLWQDEAHIVWSVLI